MSNNNIGNISDDIQLKVDSDIKINQSALINDSTSGKYISTSTIINMIASVIK